MLALCGVEQVVLLSFQGYRALTTDMPNLKAYLLGGPKVDEFQVERTGIPAGI